VTKSAGSPSQGGGTGSNPVGTTTPNVQVTGPIWEDEDHYDQAALDSTDPATIPRQVRTRHPCRRSGDTGRCLSLLVSSRHWQEHAVGRACLHLPEVETVGASAGRTFKTGVGRELPGGFDSRPPPRRNGIGTPGEKKYWVMSSRPFTTISSTTQANRV
jgi:hypothetical protein